MSDRVTPINADTARRLTEQNLKGPVIEPWIDYLYLVIHATASQGKYEFTHPFQNRKQLVGATAPDYPSTEMERAIRQKLEKEGFTWKDHPDPDPGHPASGPYTTVSWK